MKIISRLLVTIGILSSCFSDSAVIAQNPFITDQFTADPSARVFNGKVFVYPSHDILANEERGRIGWFCMADYHVFSSADLVNWTDHGVIVTQEKVDWVAPESYSMWAPDCIESNGKYYFYFPSTAKSEDQRRGFSIGVAISVNPEGPYVPELHPIEGVRGIDPNPFIDKDGQAYLYWSMGDLFVAKLKDNMLELDGEPVVIKEMPEEGLKEGPYMFERNGIYYMTYPHVENNIERIEYATGDNPMGPFTFAGVIMAESPMGCWTNHQSIIEYNDQWYLFYHNNEFSPEFDKNRSICVDSLFFNEDGSIQKVKPTKRGVGVSSAQSKIQIDRYSQKSDDGIRVELLDTLNTFRGWKAIFVAEGSWLQYNTVDFGNKKFKTLQANVYSEKGGTLELHLESPDGPLLSKIDIKEETYWSNISFRIKNFNPGIHNIVMVLTSEDPVEIDWLTFIP